VKEGESREGPKTDQRGDNRHPRLISFLFERGIARHQAQELRTSNKEEALLQIRGSF